jgi:sec-independent protein translocase protein TatC
MPALRPISYEDRLSVIDHLDELRKRLFVSVGALLLAFCVCFAFNGQLISVLNRALPPAAKTGLGSQARQDAALHKGFVAIENAAAGLSTALARSHGVTAAAAREAAALGAAARQVARALPKNATTQDKPITIGVSEAFTTTLMVVGYFALMITLPILLYQLYAFVIPALSRDERRIAVPSMIAAPVLFVAGCVFTYFAIVPPAIHFLQGYNSSDFQNLLQAKAYYKFEIILMMGIGLAFQVPLLLLALQKAGIITASTLTLNWRYATVLIAVIAAALPGVDPVSMFMETLPLVLLYLSSIVLLKFVERRNRRRLLAEATRATKPSDH